MQKIITILFLFISVTLSAQIREKYTDFGTILYKGSSEETLIEDQFLYHNDSGYILVQYTSEFEEPMELFLGHFQESAKVTLSDLIDIANKQNHCSIGFDLCDNKYFLASTKSFLGRAVVVRPCNRDGYCTLYVTHLKDMISHIK